MSEGRILTNYYDFKENNTGKSEFFFLEHVLKARVDLHIETGENEYDQELNIYIAGLLNSLVTSGRLLEQKPYVSPFDTDVRLWLSEHPGLRNEYTVYRDNADFGLLLLGLFLGFEHPGSYHHIVCSVNDGQGRIALYYELAASALAHLRGNDLSLVGVLETLAEHMDEIIAILNHAAGSYFDLMERLSDGSMFHLGRELDECERKKQYDQKLDEFLRCYSCYREEPSPEMRERLMMAADEVRQLNGDFRFDGVE